jgi:tricorn protease
MKFAVVLLATLMWSGPAAAEPSFSEPALSPDGSEIAFVSGGDIWGAPARGGEARLLVSHPATESRPLYSPDGKRLAFVSTRTGGGNIYILTIATGALKRLTFDDGPEQLDGWSRDGRWIYFSSASQDIARMNDIFRVSSGGGTPMPVSAERYVNEFAAAPSPDGAKLAFTALGISSSQWWRNGHSHIDESEIWVRSPVADTRLTEPGAKSMWPMWSPDGRTIYYVSDRSGAGNLWSRTLRSEGRFGPPVELTQFKTGRALWPVISNDGRSIVFERNFRIWKFDVATRETAEVPLTLGEQKAGPSIQRLHITTGFEELALAPDGQKLAVVAHGEVFTVSAADGGGAIRITSTPQEESQVSWAPDSRRLAYISDRDGTPHAYLYDSATREETRLTGGARADSAPAFSPDGSTIAFLRGGRELRAIDLATGRERMLAAGYLERPPLPSGRPFAWSPDSRWIAFASISGKLFRNFRVVPAAGGPDRAVSFLANGGGSTVSWSPDGGFLLFDTNQRTEAGQLARVDLMPRTPRFREEPPREMFRDDVPVRGGSVKEPSPAPDPVAREASKTVGVDFDGIRQRLSLLPMGLDLRDQAVSPDGRWVVVTASAAGQQNLYVWPLDDLAKDPPVARQLTSSPGSKRNAQFSADGREVFYLDDGQVAAVNLETRQTRKLAVAVDVEVDFDLEKMEVFEQAWQGLRDNFFDPGFHGVDWSAVRARYEPLAAGARTGDELRRILSLMCGELNASHMGISAPAAPGRYAVGKLGLRFDREEYERSGRLRVVEVIPLGPAALAGQIRPGDSLDSVDGVPAVGAANLDALLENKTGRRVVLGVSSGGEKKEVAVRPVDQNTEKGLLYRAWADANRAYVARASRGRLGYVHMLDMSADSLAQLYVDLDSDNQAREGVVIDLRNNNGGFVNGYALDVLARRSYLTMAIRDMPPAPARSVLGQRALERPTILLTNMHTLSDAEDFSEGYRALKLGKVTGEPTAGWIIYASETKLIDGSLLRLPFMKVLAADGEPMEMHPRAVDVPVARPVGEGLTDKDSQLDAAVAELLREIGRGPATAVAEPRP